VGVGWTRAIVLLFLSGIIVNTVQLAQRYPDQSGLTYFETQNADRANVTRFLNDRPGDHLVLLRYSKQHNVEMEWVYNAADIDHAKIVWAREIPGMDLAPLLLYYANRTKWVLEPDANPIGLYPYADAPPRPEN
jgi:hypothetical protein